MRSLRLLLLVALVALAGTVYGIYKRQRTTSRVQRPNPPAPVPLDTKSSALDYEWGQSDSGRPRVKISARNFVQASVGDKVLLENLTLQIFNKEGTKFDLIKSPHAEFNQDQGKLYSAGDCEITLDVPFKPQPDPQNAPAPEGKVLTVVKTSGISFDSKTGFASTDRNVAFSFAGGEGVATGASYDPEKRELHLVRDVVLNMRGKGLRAKKMKVESGELVYKEGEQLVTLLPWSRMTRDQTVIDAGGSIIKILEKAIDSIDAQSVHGIDKEPKKQLEYAGDTVHVKYNDDGEMEKLDANGHARIVSHATGSNTTVTGNRVELFFTMNKDGESELSNATLNGAGRVESVPVADPKGKTADTKLITADSMDLRMKPGGRELSRVETHVPGALEFVPHQPTRHRRLVKATRMTIDYGARNEVQAFSAVDAQTETDPSDEEKKRKKAAVFTAFTSSKTMDAAFDDQGQLKQIHQNENFRYTEGDRKAQADVATLDNTKNVMLLENHARMSDGSGSTVGDRIRLEQNTGDFVAVGHASTTRIPEPPKNGKQKSSSMLDEQEPMQGTADSVASANRNREVHYAGNAVVWQTSNRITADTIDIDRIKKTLVADGKVVTQFLDSKDTAEPEPAAPVAKFAPVVGKPEPASADLPGAISSAKAPVKQDAVFTVVRAQHMVYTDMDHLALYSGTVSFARPTLTVKSDQLRAYLNDNDSDEDSRINRAFGDGKVVIMETSLNRARVGSSEHAEYYTEEGKIVLTGGTPRLDDPKRGKTEGQKVTYFTDNERLEVDGTGPTPVKSHLRRRKK